LAFELGVKNWRSYVPILDVARDYERDDFQHDLVAGLIVGVITIPQAIAYAFLAGLPAQTGLYACLVPLAVYALLGSSKQMVVGPVAVAALMVAAAIDSRASLYGDDPVGISTVLCVQSGVLLLALRATNMGGVVNLLSHPVIGGFVNAAAILIIVSQIPPLLGIEPTSGNTVDRVIGLGRSLTTANPVTATIGIGSAVVMWLVHHHGVAFLNLFGLRLPANHAVSRLGPLVVTVVASLVVWLAGLNLRDGVAVIGAVPSGLPGFTLPPYTWEMWIDLLPTSTMIALVAYVESFSIGTTLASRQRTRVNSNQELIALGLANAGGAFTGAYPVAGSFSRSSVNYQAGGRTPVSSLICMVVIVLTLLYFTPLIAPLPHAALAAIVIVSVTGLMNFTDLRSHWRVYRQDTVTQLVTLVTVLAFGVEAGLITGVALSIAFFVRKTSKPHITIVGRVGSSEHFRATSRYDVETFPHVAAIRVDESLFFANANGVENRILKIIQRRSGTHHVLLVCSAVNMVDVSGLEMLHRLNDTLEQMNITLHLSEVKSPVMQQLEAANFILSLTGSVFFTTDQAMRDLSQRR